MQSKMALNSLCSPGWPQGNVKFFRGREYDTDQKLEYIKTGKVLEF
jgi:hypothetical protein